MSSEEDRNRTTRHDWVILGLLALSLTANVALGIGFLRLASVSPPPSQRAAGTSDIPAIGTRVPPIVAQRLGGGRETIAYGPSEQPTLLYVFTPACQWCTRNLDNLRTLVAHAESRYRIVGLSLDPNAASYVERIAFKYPVYINPSPETIRAYGLGPTPQTVVIANTGEIQRSWIGAYVGPVKTQVEQLFGVILPGIAVSRRDPD